MAAGLLPVAPALLADAGERFLPHGYCFLWNRPLLWTHVAADTAIALSYITISFSLAWLVHRARRDIPFSRVFLMFGAFIITCGLTHLLEVITFWDPIYPTLGGVKVVTAIASVSTAVVMPRLAPRVTGMVREARMSRERELEVARAQARSGALEEANAKLAALNVALEAALASADRERRAAEGARAEAEAAHAAAVEANRVKADFLAHMSHELRTPLNAIGGHVELVQLGVHGPVTGAQQGAFARVQAAQRHLLGLINDVLNFAKLEAGRVDYVIAAVPVAPVVHEVAALLEPSRLAKQQAIEIDEGAPGLAVRADAEKLRQVLLNLLGNAIKYTGPEGRLALRVEQDTDGEGTVTIAVSDTGMGIPPERLESVFEPFVQVTVPGATPATVQGTGLGLAISRELARAMGGDLVAESAPGAGSTFRLRLPAA